MFEIAGHIISYTPLILCFVVAISLLISTRKENDARFIMVYFFLVCLVFFLCHTLKVNRQYKYLNYLLIHYIAASVICIPLFYVYISSLCLIKYDQVKFIKHFFPAFLFIYLGYFMLFSLTYKERYQFTRLYFTGGIGSNSPEYLVYLISAIKYVFLFQCFFYSVLIIKKMMRYKKRLNDFTSDVLGAHLNWAYLTICLTILWAIIAGSAYFILIERTPTISLIGMSYDVLVSFFIVAMYLLVLIQPDNPQNYLHFENNRESGEMENIHLPRIKEKLIQCIERRELYLKKDLTIIELCSEIGTNRTYLSNIINHEFGMNFHTFVNNFRVNKAAEFLKTSDNTLEEIASMSGFSCLASFNRVFRKSYGCYPGSYRKRIYKSD